MRGQVIVGGALRLRIEFVDFEEHVRLEGANIRVLFPCHGLLQGGD